MVEGSGTSGVTSAGNTLPPASAMIKGVVSSALIKYCSEPFVPALWQRRDESIAYVPQPDGKRGGSTGARPLLHHELAATEIEIGGRAEHPRTGVVRIDRRVRVALTGADVVDRVGEAGSRYNQAGNCQEQ